MNAMANATKGGHLFKKGTDMLVQKSGSKDAPWDHATADGGWQLGSAGPPWAPGFKGKGRTPPFPPQAPEPPAPPDFPTLPPISHFPPWDDGLTVDGGLTTSQDVESMWVMSVPSNQPATTSSRIWMPDHASTAFTLVPFGLLMLLVAVLVRRARAPSDSRNPRDKYEQYRAELRSFISTRPPPSYGAIGATHIQCVMMDV